MATTAYRGIGCTLTGVTMGLVTNVKSIGGPEPKAEKVEITSLDSPGGYKEFMAGDIDPGELKLDCYYTATVWEAFVSALQSGTADSFTLVIQPVGQAAPLATYTFNGVVIDCPMKIEPGSITFTATIAISGAIGGI